MRTAAARSIGSAAFLVMGASAALVLSGSGPAWLVCQRGTLGHMAGAVQEHSALRTAALIVCVAVAIGVCAVLLVSIWRAHRTGVERGGALRECLWALVPVVIVGAAAAPSIAAYRSAAHDAAPTRSVHAGAGFECRLTGQL